VDPGDIEVLLSMYPDDIEDLWSEAGVLSDLACDDLDRLLNPYGVRTHPENGDNLVHRHSIKNSFTRCGQQVKATAKGEDISESEIPCELCYDPDW
jgi:hypothetical protein